MPHLATLNDLLAWEDANGNTASRWLAVVLATLAIYLALQLTRVFLAGRANRLARGAAADWFLGVEILLRRTTSWFLLLLALVVAVAICSVQGWEDLITTIIKVAFFVQAALWGDALLKFGTARYIERRKETDAASATTLAALGFLGRLVVWVVAALSAIASAGFNITTLVAGLGVGGVAVALAAQNILGDLFASAAILLDKPFVLGDFIVIDDKMGSIEHIGLKTTRLRSLTGEQLVFANADLLKSRIHNYKRMNERRILFTIGVAYETPYETVAAIPVMLREIIQSQKSVRFDRAHFARYGDSALIFEVVYYVLAADYNKYMDVQQAVNLAIFERFAKADIEFAYPTRTVYVHGT